VNTYFVQLKVHFVNIFQHHLFDFELNLLIFGQPGEKGYT